MLRIHSASSEVTHRSRGNSLRANIGVRILQLVKDAMPAHQQTRRLTGAERLQDLGLTSLRLIGLVVALEEDFELDEIALGQFSSDTTVGAMIAFCEASCARSERTPTPHEREVLL